MLKNVLKARRFLASQWWTLQRFGLSPRKAWYRLAKQSESKILCVSIPKAGTHLLERALCLHPMLYRKLIPTVNDSNIQKWNTLAALLEELSPGQIIVAHLSFTPDTLEAIETRDIRCIFLIRDPRDIVISQTFYISRNKKHPLHRVFRSQTNFKDKLRLAVEGHAKGGLPSIGRRLEHFAGWLESGCLVVRFEDLIGPQGSGDKSKQLKTLRSIYDFIEVDVDEDRIISISHQLFSNISPTFRKGAVGQWKQYFDAETKKMFKAVAGKALIQYGYEKNNQW